MKHQLCIFSEESSLQIPNVSKWLFSQTSRRLSDHIAEKFVLHHFHTFCSGDNDFNEFASGQLFQKEACAVDYTEELGHRIWKERQHQTLFVNAADTTLISSNTVGLKQENTAWPENVFAIWVDKYFKVLNSLQPSSFAGADRRIVWKSAVSCIRFEAVWKIPAACLKAPTAISHNLI